MVTIQDCATCDFARIILTEGKGDEAVAWSFVLAVSLEQICRVCQNLVKMPKNKIYCVLN